MNIINSSQSIAPVSGVIKVISSRNKRDGKNKKNKESKDRGFSSILTEEIDKTKKVLKR